MVLNLVKGRHGNLALTMMDEDYRAQTGFAFVPPHNPCDHPQSMGSSQEQALGTEKLQKNQALLCRYTTVEEALKKNIDTAVEPVFLSPLVDQITGFGQVSALTMQQYLFPATGRLTKVTSRKMQSR